LRAVIGRDDVYNHYIDSTQKALYARVLPLREDFEVLDFGCGNGRWALWFAPRVTRVVGVDLSPTMVSTAQRLASEREARNADFTVLGDGAPFPDDSFDLVNCVWVLKYILSGAEAIRTIAEFSRVTKPGGYVAIIDQVNQSGDILVETEGYYRGRALYRMPGSYIEAFKNNGMRLRYHAITNASPLFWAYSRVQRALYGPAEASLRPGLRWIAAASVRGDLLTGRAMRFRSGHHFFLFQKEGEADGSERGGIPSPKPGS